MKKVALTGSEGTIGRVLTGRSLVENAERPLLSADITRIDRQPDKGGAVTPFIQSDLQDPAFIKELLTTHDVLIHGAWNTQEGILQPDFVDPENVRIAENILHYAEELGEFAVAKLIFLSSVNAHVPTDWRERRDRRNYISANELPHPQRHNRRSVPGGTSRYGESKVAVEQAAYGAAQKGMHVVIPRIGGVNLRDEQSSAHETHQAIYNDEQKGRYFDARPSGWEDAVRLRHEDLVASIQKLVDRLKRPGVFERYNLVSDTPDRVHVLPDDDKI